MWEITAMRIWSSGLGEQELVLDFAKGNVTREGDEVIVRGIIKEPVDWNFEVTITREDVLGLLHVIVSAAVLRHFSRNMTGFFTFIRDKFIMRRMGMRPSQSADS